MRDCLFPGETDFAPARRSKLLALDSVDRLLRRLKSNLCMANSIQNVAHFWDHNAIGRDQNAKQSYHDVDM